MFRNLHSAKSFFSSILLISICFSGMLVFPQDIVASDDITGGASVFVFRKSRKAPQEKAAGRSVRAGSAKGRSSRNRYDTQLAANRKKRSAQVKANQALLAKNRSQQRNAKLTLSNTLTAKADALLESKQTDQAIATYREALKNNPKNADAKSGLSDALVAKGIDTAGDTNNISAGVYFDEALTLDPMNDVAYAKLGDLYDAANDSAKARMNYEKALQINPEMVAVYVPVGISYLNSGEIAKAEDALQNAEKRGVSDAEFFNLKGMTLYKQNKNAESLAAFEKALSIDGRNATSKYYRAALLDRMNQPEQSLVAYRETVAIAPEYAPAWFDLGVASYNRGDYPDAEKSYKEAIRIDPDYYQAHANLASTLRQQERFAEANAEYKLAEVGIKDNPDLYSEWGYCLGKTNEWDKSVVRLEQARKVSPDAIDDTNVGWGYYNSAQIDKKNKKDAEANAKLQKSKESLQAAVQKNPKLDAAYMNLGSTNNALGDFEAAVAALNVALSLRSDWVIAINQLGLGYRGLNNLSAAIQQFNRVVTLDANNVGGLFNLGSAQYASGDKKGAKKTQDRLKKLNPELANQLGSIISGKIIEAGTREIKKKIPLSIPRFP
ncbi:MAG TPA: tetratricopeptide repeat protein [Pyrinomonadaceae bacterium]|nr:tetratricopeptide repeat protein [Pyrinomonadaceae bacterium]